VGGTVSFVEFPVYVPVEGEHLMGVVCLPEGDIEDVGVVLLTGGNYTRTHRNRMWVDAARELAGRGVPSVRFDYRGVGDSEGTMVLSLDDPPWRDASAMIDFLEQVTGISKVTLASTCFGGRVAAAVAARRDDVVSMTALPLPVLLPLRHPTKAPLRRRIRQSMKRTDLGARLLRNPGVRRARTAVASRRGKPELRVNPGLRGDLARAAAKGVRIRFVFGEGSKELPDLRKMLEELEANLSPDQLSLITVDVIEGTDVQRFQTFEDQRIVIDAAVESAERALGREPHEAGA
jgi:pimeloyl-ACP methyl ester carboxylesterase